MTDALAPPLTSRAVKIVWHWLTMGPYHFARMNAVAKQPGIELTVVETACHDDHHWKREVNNVVDPKN